MNYEPIKISWFEKGFIIFSEKLGDFLLLFDQFVNKFYVHKESQNQYLIVELSTPLFFKKFS